MHYNENSHNEHSQTKDGNTRYSIIFPKYKYGEHAVKKLSQSPTYGMPKMIII
jgi:hypothetical protein